MSKIIRVIGDFHISDATPRSMKIPYFDNCLKELELVCEGADSLICLGDFFDKSTIPDAYKFRLVRVLSDIRKKGCEIYTIVGNHDIIGYNMSDLFFARTTINLLSDISKRGGDFFKIIPNCGVSIFGVRFVPYNGCDGSELVPSNEDNSVLLAHSYYNNSVDDILNISKEELSDKGYLFAFFGHDHEPHPDCMCGKTTVVRPGSFTRSSSHGYNLNRKPYYVDIVVSCDGNVKIERKVLESALDSRDIFRDECFEKRKDDDVFDINLTQVFSGLSESVDKDSRFSMSDILTEVGAPDSVVEYLKSVHKKLNLKWS